MYIFRFSSGGEEPASQASISDEPLSVVPETTSNQSTVTANEPPSEQPRKRHNSGHKVGFNPEWQQGRPWLQVRVGFQEDDDAVTSMICSLCQEFSTGSNSNKTWVDAGCKTLRIDKVKAHEVSDQHKSALALSLSKKIPDVTDNISSAATDSITDALKVLRFITMKNLPLDLFKDMIDLCIDVGSASLANLRLVKNASYSSWDIMDDLLTTLSDKVKEEVVTEVKQSPSFSTMVDEVCDRTTEKHLAMCVRYISTEGAVKTSFLSDTSVPEATAENLTSKIISELDRHDLNVQKMTGFTSDGAAVFLGKKNGVGKRLKDINPHMVTTHCKDHRLALACRDSYAKVPGMRKLDETLENLHRFYKYSAKKTASLKEVQAAFNEVPLAIKQAKHHRWLSHEKAVTSIVRSYKSLIVDLESSSISNDPVGNGLLKSLKDTDNLRLLLLLADVLPHITALSLFFQRKNVHLGMVKSVVDKTLRMVEIRMTTDGPWLQKTEKLMTDCGIVADQPSENFHKVRSDFLQALKQNIEARFQDTDIIESMSILDLQDQEDIPTFFGDLEMQTLAEYFGLEAETLNTQWQGFLELIKMSSAPRSLNYFLELLYGKSHAEKGLLVQFPLVGHVIAAAGVLPLSTAEVERVFSQLKLIKTDHRCSLKTQRVEQLLNIKLNCTDELFSKLIHTVVTTFFKMKSRRLVTLTKNM